MPDLFAQILKSLVARNHEAAMRFVTLLLQLFSDPDIAWDAARAIGCAVALEGGVLDKKNFIVIKVEQQYIVLNYLG